MPLTLVGDGSTVVTGDTQAVPDQPTSITLQATYIVPDSLTVTEVGFYYGTDSTNLTTKVTAAPVESPFSYTIDSLTAGATYYYRAYIKIGGNETRGGLKSFSTLAAPTIDLAEVTSNTTVEDGYTVTGTLGANVKISIADGATVTLDGVNITNLGNNCD